MSPGLEVLSGVFIHVGRSQYAVDTALCWQRDRTDRRCIGAVGSIDNLFAARIEQAAVECLEANADFLLLNSCHGLPIERSIETKLSAADACQTADSFRCYGMELFENLRDHTSSDGATAFTNCKPHALLNGDWAD